MANWNIRKNNRRLITYILFIPFFFPRGFAEYSQTYKMIYTLWLYASSVILLIELCLYVSNSRVRIKPYISSLLLFQIYFIVDTIILQRGIHEGLQKLFIVPILCLGCYVYFETKPKVFLESISNILIVLFLLNACVFNPVFFSGFFSASKKLLFLGHVQMAGQIGLLGIFVSYLLKETKKKNAKKAKLLLFLSIITMILSQTISALICLVIYLIGMTFGRIKAIDNKGKKTKLIILVFLTINFAAMGYLYTHNWSFAGIGIASTIHGRLAIWNEIVNLLQNHWLFGYGAYGYKIQVYWSAWTNPEGMIYAHNQFFQLLLDGGIVLLLLFVRTVFKYIQKMNLRITSTQIRQITIIVLISFLTLMLIESPAEYFYFFIVLSIFPYIGIASRHDYYSIIE